MGRYDDCADEELLVQAKEGNAEIIDHIMEKYKHLVRKKARALYLMGGDNDDLIQEGMIGLFKAIRDFDQAKEASFRSFADMCISRQLYSAIQASNRQKHVPLNTYISLNSGTVSQDEREIPLQEVLASSGLDNPEELVIGQENARMMEEELKKSLSLYEREVLSLYLEGKDYAEIGSIMGKTQKSIDNALQRIRKKVLTGIEP